MTNHIKDTLEAVTLIVGVEVNFKNPALVKTLIDRVSDFVDSAEVLTLDAITEACKCSAFSVTLPYAGHPFIHYKVPTLPSNDLEPPSVDTRHSVRNILEAAAGGVINSDEGITLMVSDNDTGEAYRRVIDLICHWWVSLPNEQDPVAATVYSNHGDIVPELMEDGALFSAFSTNIRCGDAVPAAPTYLRPKEDSRSMSLVTAFPFMEGLERVSTARVFQLETVSVADVLEMKFECARDTLVVGRNPNTLLDVDASLRFAYRTTAGDLIVDEFRFEEGDIITINNERGAFLFKEGFLFEYK